MRSSKANAVGSLAQRAAVQEVPTYLVVPSAILRTGLEHSLAHTRFAIAASVSSFAHLQYQVFDDNREVLLIAEATAGHGEVLAHLKALMNDHPRVRGVVLVESCEPQNLLSAYQQGIDGYLTTSISAEALAAYLSLVMMGESVVSSAALAMMSETAQLLKFADQPVSDGPWDGVNRRDRHGLTYREASVLRCLMEGESNKVIAFKCDITESTVKVHIKSICRKLGVSNRTKAALWAKSHLPPVERRSARTN